MLGDLCKVCVEGLELWGVPYCQAESIHEEINVFNLHHVDCSKTDYVSEDVFVGIACTEC